MVVQLDDKPIILSIADEEDSTTPFGKHIDLDETEKNKIIEHINKYIVDVEALRDREHLEDKWNDADDSYEGIMEEIDFPFEDPSNLNVQIVQQKTDVSIIKANQQIFTPPFMQLKPIPAKKQINDLMARLERKEKWVDHKLYDEVKIEEEGLPQALFATYLKGTGALKVYWDIRVEPVDEPERYDPEITNEEGTQVDIERFVDRFGYKQSEKYLDGLERLMAGEPIKIYVAHLKVLWNRPKVDWIPLKNLKIMPNIAQLYNHRIIPEEIDLTWADLVSGVKSEKYPEDLLTTLQQKYQDTYDKMIYPAVEALYYYDYSGDGERKTIMTYLKDENIMLESNTYPYEHNMINILLYKWKLKNGSIYGYGMYDLLKHVNKALNQLWNSTANAGAWQNAPSFKALESASNTTIKRFGPAMVWKVKKMENVEQFPIARTSIDNFKFIELMMREGALTSQVSDLASGRETMLDPRAPAQKVLVLLQETNAAIADGIKKIHHTNEKLVEMIDKLYQQYYRFTEEKEAFEYEGETIELSKEDLFTPCLYKANLSPLTVNKGLQHQIDGEIMGVLLKFPTINQDMNKINLLLEVYLKNAPGDWPSYKDKLIPKPKEAPAGPEVPGAPAGEGEPPEAVPRETPEGAGTPGVPLPPEMTTGGTT